MEDLICLLATVRTLKLNRLNKYLWAKFESYLLNKSNFISCVWFDPVAYSVSGPMPIAEPDETAGKRPGIAPPDADTGEIENEYAYAAINEYATIGAREKSLRPAVPTAPVPSVAAGKPKTTPYYFQLLEGGPDEKPEEATPTTSTAATTTTTTTAADCYTKVVRKPKEEKPKHSVYQYDRLDRINIRPPPTNGGESGSPSDNEYGTLASSLKTEEIDLK